MLIVYGFEDKKTLTIMHQFYVIFYVKLFGFKIKIKFMSDINSAITLNTR